MDITRSPAEDPYALSPEEKAELGIKEEAPAQSTSDPYALSEEEKAELGVQEAVPSNDAYALTPEEKAELGIVTKPKEQLDAFDTGVAKIGEYAGKAWDYVKEVGKTADDALEEYDPTLAERVHTVGKQVWSAGGDIGGAAIALLSSAQRATVGNIVANMRPDLKKELLTAIENSRQDPNQIQTFADISKMANEAAPDLYLSQVYHKKIYEGLKSLGLSPTKAKIGTLVGGVGLDILTDPMTYFTLGASSTKHLAKLKNLKKEAALLKVGEDAGGEILKQIAKYTTPGKTFAEQVKDGERAILSLKAPLLPLQLDLVKSQKLANLWTNVVEAGAIQKAKRVVPSLQIDTGFGEIDNAETAHSLADTAANLKSTYLEARLASTPVVESVADALLQFPEPEKAKRFLARMGVKYSDNEFESAKTLAKSIDDIIRETDRYRAQAAGTKLLSDTYKPGENTLQEFKDMFDGELPKDLEEFIGRDQYGISRIMKDDAVRAMETLATKENAFVKGFGGLKTTPDSARQSAKFSDFAMNLLYGKKTGFVEAFESSPVRKTLDTVKDLIRSGEDARFANTVKKYGGSKDEMVKRIMDSRAIRDDLKRVGAPVPQAILNMASINPSQLRQVKDMPWQRLHSNTVDNVTTVMRENMWFPPEVAHMINTKFGPRLYKNDNVIAKGLGWVNDQWRKSVLTRPLRLTREMAENATAYVMLGGNLKHLATAPFELLAASKLVDWASEETKVSGKFKTLKKGIINTAKVGTRGATKIASLGAKENILARTFLGSQFSESMGTIDNIPKFKTSIKDAKNLDSTMFSQMEMLHDTAKSGQKQAMKELLGYDESTLKRVVKNGFNPAKWVEGINDSGLARFTRAFFGGTSSNVTKYALAKSYVGRGFDPITALARADKELVSFRNIGEGLQNARWVSPFASYNMRSIMRLPAIFASSPAGPTFFNKVKQGFENYSGWSPEDQTIFSHFIGNRFMPSPIVGPLLRGTKEMADDPEYFNNLTTDIATSIFGKEDAEGQVAGSVMVMNFPDVWKQGINFMNPEDFMNNVGPMLKAAMVFMGRDPYTNKPLPYHDTDNTHLETMEKITKAFEVANPIAFNDLYGAANIAKVHLEENFVKHMVNFGMDKDNADYFYKKIFPENDIKVRKSLEKAMRDTIKWNTFGFGSITNTSLQAKYKTFALMKAFNKIKKDTMNIKAPRGEATEALIESLRRDGRRLVKDIQYNVELLDAYEAGIEGALPALSDEEKVLQKAFEEDPDIKAVRGLEEEQAEEAPQGVPQEQVEQEPVVDEAQEYLDGASYAPDDGRSPAMARGSPRMSGEIIQRGSHATQDYMDSESDPYALTPEERASLEEQQKVMGGGDAPAMTHEELVYQDLIRQGLSPEDARQIIEQSVQDNNDLLERGPASHRAVELGSGGGAPAGGGGSGLGMAIGAGAAAPFIKDKAPPDEQMGMGSGMSEEERRLYLMSPSQLAEQPDSAAKQKIKDIKSMENQKRMYKMSAVPSRSHLPGYEEIIVEGDVYDKDHPSFAKELNKVDEEREKEWKSISQSLIPKFQDAGYDDYLGASFREADLEMRKKYGENWRNHQGVDSWVRGFAPNPDTFVILESQRNKNDKKADETRAINKAIEYARKAGYKNIGIADAESVAQMQGHSGVKDWVSRRYDKNFLKHMGKVLKQSPSDKEHEFKGEDIPDPKDTGEYKPSKILGGDEKKLEQYNIGKDVRRTIDSIWDVALDTLGIEVGGDPTDSWYAYKEWTDMKRPDIDEFIKENFAPNDEYGKEAKILMEADKEMSELRKKYNQELKLYRETESKSDEIRRALYRKIEKVSDRRIPKSQKLKYKVYSLDTGDKKKDEAQYLKDIGGLMKSGMSQEEAEVYAEKMFKNKGNKK